MQQLTRHIVIVFVGICVCAAPLAAQVTDESDAVFTIVIPNAAARDVDMGRLPVGDVRDSLVAAYVVNTGRAPIRIDSILITGPDAASFAVSGGIPPVQIPQAGTHDAIFTFHPTSEGNKRADILMYTQADTQRYVITGEGLLPQIRLEAAYIDFGAVPVGGRRDTLVETVVRNLTAGPVTVSAAEQEGPDMQQFSVLEGAAPCTIPPLGAHAMRLRYAPRRGGRTSGSIRFHVDGTEDRPVAQLFGEGIGVQASAEIATDTLSAAPGEIIHVPIRLRGAQSLGLSGATTLQTELRCRASLLVPVGSTPEGRLEEGMRVIPLSGLPLLPLREDIIAEYPFMAVLGDTVATALELRNSLALGGDVVLRESPGHFALEGICPEGGQRLFASAGRLQLAQNIPNPFNASTVITFETIERAPARLLVRDLHGRIIRVLFDAFASPGRHHVVFDAAELPSGTYICELRSGMLLLRRFMQLVK